uniref:Transcription factor MYB35-like n=1 Tax=Nelumbo nucifera TaxID=4432 RepID=A0A822YTL8_NELNU|nr:TPA_asm: hypothetical protein HUJ06_005389 [Nelumbo nucifera]
MGRPPCCDKSNVKRGLWTEEEDAKILAYVSKHGTGLKRCGKSCRLRWTNYLRPDLKHESFTPQEEELIINLHQAIGSRWSLIAAQLPGRTDNDVKNYWNTKLRKKLYEMGIDPVTHKPFSQILADYGNIGGLPRAGNRIGSLNRDLRNAFMSKSESAPLPQEAILNASSHSIMTIRTPKMEPIQDCHTNNNGSSSNNNNHCWDLLAELQAIKLVTEASNSTNQETIPPLFFSEGSSMSSSSVSILPVNSAPPMPCQSSPMQTMPSSPFSWSEFLVEDAVLPSEQQTQCYLDFQGLSSSTGSSSQIEMHDDITQNGLNSEANKTFYDVGETDYGGGQGFAGIDKGGANNAFGASSSSDNSFIDAILDQDGEMSWEFVDILSEPFY